MASQTAICNRALEFLGGSKFNPITNINDGSGPAKALKRVYADTLRALLVDHEWHFAKKRASLAASATVPAWGFDRGFPVPADFLKLLQIQCAPDYSLEADPSGSQIILTDAAAPLNILYIYDVTDPGRLPPHFVDAFASRLAVDICEDLTQSASKKQTAMEEHADKLAIAKRNNGLQKQSDPIPASSWVTSRGQAIWGRWR
jgi:hypothetical protein